MDAAYRQWELVAHRIIRPPSPHQGRIKVCLGETNTGYVRTRLMTKARISDLTILHVGRSSCLLASAVVDQCRHQRGIHVVVSRTACLVVCDHDQWSSVC